MANQGGSFASALERRRRRGGDAERFRNRTVYLPSGEYNHGDIAKAIGQVVGADAILALVNTTGNWHVTVKDDVNLEDLCINGIGLNGEDVECKLIARKIVTVSFMGVPYYVGNDLLSEKLRDFGVKQVSPWVRKTYSDLPNVESGICHCRVELPDEVASLPYATRIQDVNILIKHNNQTKVCNYCLREGHLLRSCPEKMRCYLCGLIGHLRAQCPDREDASGVDSDSNATSESEQDLDDLVQGELTGDDVKSFGEGHSFWDSESEKDLVIDETIVGANVVVEAQSQTTEAQPQASNNVQMVIPDSQPELQSQVSNPVQRVIPDSQPEEKGTRSQSN
jgi:hypothetical protein